MGFDPELYKGRRPLTWQLDR